jgi:SNF2 family DNA or RNA helicase
MQLHKSDEFRGVLWEQGTGKTKLAIDLLAHLYDTGKVKGLFVLAPNGVHLNWVTDELPKHLPTEFTDVEIHAFQTRRAKTKGHQAQIERVISHRGLSILTMSYDAFMTDAGKRAAWDFLRKRPCLYVLDESHRVKSPKAKRTKSVLLSGKHAPFRRIMTGTPIANGPFDIYSQMKFLKTDFWKPFGLDSFAAFRAHFGCFVTINGPGGRKIEILDRENPYKNIDQLYKIIEPHCSRVLKEDVLDLPPKLYTRRLFEMSPTQARMYREVRDEFMTWMDMERPCPHCEGRGVLSYEGADFTCDECSGAGKKTGLLVSAPLAITRLLRLQQITCGYVPDETGEPFHDIPGENPRLDSFMELAEDTPHQAIVWARFRRDIDKICAALGKNCVRFDGAVSSDERQRNKEAFKRGDVQWIASNPAVGGEGHTLTEAKTSCYYNNSFKLIERLQSEDRPHRRGQDQSVLNVDINAEGTVDENITKALVEKRDIASKILGDELSEWIRSESKCQESSLFSSR